DERLKGALKQALDDSDFNGKGGSVLVIPTLGQIAARRIVITGIGNANGRRAQDLTRAWGRAARAARDAGARTVASVAPPNVGEGIAESFRAASEGVVLALYRFLAYRTVDLPTKEVETFTFFDDHSEARKGVEIGNAIAQGVCLARDLGNMPADVLYPETLALQAQEIALANDLSCVIYDREALER